MDEQQILRPVDVQEKRQPELVARLALLEQENLQLRQALAERTMAPATRRVVGRMAAALVLLVSAAAVTFYVLNDGTSVERRAAFMRGYHQGWQTASEEYVPVVPNAPTINTPPAAPPAAAKP
jgi:hypothetical protein